VWGLSPSCHHRRLVENPKISCTLVFHALSEDETVWGVQELMEACCGQDSEAAHSLTVCGHSFGSFPISRLLRDPASRPSIRLCILMDRVTLLLSDPAVMANFLHSREVSNIRVIASSELFTEFYLRRHFSWYNCGWTKRYPPHLPPRLWPIQTVAKYGSFAHCTPLWHCPKMTRLYMFPK
jgi:hypothetical protein